MVSLDELHENNRRLDRTDFYQKVSSLDDLFKTAGYEKKSQSNVSCITYSKVKNKGITVVVRADGSHSARVEFCIFNRKSITAKSKIWAGGTKSIFQSLETWLINHEGVVSKVILGEVTHNAYIPSQ